MAWSSSAGGMTTMNPKIPPAEPAFSLFYIQRELATSWRERAELWTSTPSVREEREGLLEHSAKLLLLALLANPIGKQGRTGSLHKRPRLVENLHGAATQRDPVLPVRRRPPSWDGPRALVPIDLSPLGPPHLTPPRRRQHQKLERQPDGQRYRRCPHRTDGLADLGFSLSWITSSSTPRQHSNSRGEGMGRNQHMALSEQASEVGCSRRTPQKGAAKLSDTCGHGVGRASSRGEHIPCTDGCTQAPRCSHPH